MAVQTANRQKNKIHHLPQATIQKKAQAVLNALGSPESELSILIVDDRDMAVLNSQYLDRPGPTNVIAFPMATGAFSEISPELLGDVVISADTAAREAAAMGIATAERFTQLLVHGILHLFGYDHEQSEEEAAVMEKKSDELLAMIEESFKF